MKKTLILALALTMIASLSFAANARFVQPNATFTNGGAATTNNDDSCDIAVVPAATLLLPHFEVDFLNGPGGGPNTNFSITNTSNIPQIAHVTIWTDWSFPVLDFNIFLTGYDVQPVSLYNIIGRGELPATTATATRGLLSAANTANTSWSGGAVGACTGLPASIPGFLVAEIQGALTEGTYFDCLGQVGSDDHGANAVGYVTIDVANTCSQSLPTDPLYYSQEILYDNTLIGEYYRIDPRADTGNYAGGNPMVHIRAIPEGGIAGSTPFPVNFPFTFYDRYTAGNLDDATNKIDRRQPLPGSFAARFIYTDTDFQTNYAIWREGELGGADTFACLDLTGNAFIPIADIVRFDERENPTFFPGGGCQYSPCTSPEFTLPETSAHSVSDETVFPPPAASTDAGGWMYLNLSHLQSDPAIVPDYSVRRQTGGTHAGRSQNWVIVQMTAFGRYGVDFDAAYIENGCSVVRPDVVDAVQEVINWGATGNVTP
ncbi:MAG: hypothetical protein ACYC7A_11920 [Thermoanaerobaculia bacterium]